MTQPRWGVTHRLIVRGGRQGAIKFWAASLDEALIYAARVRQRYRAPYWIEYWDEPAWVWHLLQSRSQRKDVHGSDIRTNDDGRGLSPCLR